VTCANAGGASHETLSVPRCRWSWRRRYARDRPIDTDAEFLRPWSRRVDGRRRGARQPRPHPRPIGWIRNLIKAIATEVECRRAIQKMAQLDNDMLKDIGIDRSEIESALRCGRRRGRSWSRPRRAQHSEAPRKRSLRPAMPPGAERHVGLGREDGTMPGTNPERQEVLIVGAGPAGLFAACELARYGASCRASSNAGSSHIGRPALLNWPRVPWAFPSSG
jgi:uncharacterized protein YjiS (DUF1127 family)